MKKSILLSILIIIFVGTNITYGFDVDGLTDGMNKEIVIEKLSSIKFGKVVDEGNTVKFCDLEDKEFNKFYVVYFKNNKLVGYDKNFKPSMSNYITLFKLLTEKYGNTVKCSSKSDMSSNGEIKSLLCTWLFKKESITINYNILPSNDTLYVHYRIR